MCLYQGLPRGTTSSTCDRAWLRPRVFSRQQQIIAAKSFVVQRLEAAGAAEAGGSDWSAFTARFDAVFPTLCELFADLYGEREDCLDQLAELVLLAARSWRERAPDLKALDAA